MRIHEIKNPRESQPARARRIGRGGKRGTTSGRGQKGQKSRAGRRIRPAVRALIIRIAKRRGFRNKPLSPKALTINVGQLSEVLRTKGETGVTVISRSTLIALGIVRKNSNLPIKILSAGEVVLPLHLKGLPVSAAAEEKIQKAGGKVE